MSLIKTSPSSYFFSGDIELNPDTFKDVNIKKLTEVQLLDIIEGLLLKTLVEGDIALFEKEYKSRTNGNISEEEHFVDLNTKVNTIKTTLDNLTVGEVKSVVYWEATDW